MNVVYNGNIIKGQRVDILVAAEVVVELKSVSKLCLNPSRSVMSVFR